MKLSSILLKKTHINFIHSVDRIMDFNRADQYGTLTSFSYASSGLQSDAFSYIVLCLTYTPGLILEFSQSFPIAIKRDL